jgi:PAS domain S-box-containing protein
MRTLEHIDNKDNRVSESETLLYVKILDNMAEGVMLVSMSDATIIYTNKRFNEMFGYEEGELINRHVGTVDAGGVQGAGKVGYKLIQGLKKDEFWKGEVLNIRKDGTAFWSNINVSKFMYPNFGEVCIVVHENINDRKLTEQYLIDSEEKFRLISEQSMLGIIIIQDNTVKYTNHATSIITELSFEDICRMSTNEFYNLVHPGNRDFVIEQSRKKQSGKTDVTTHYDFRFITKTNKIKWIEIYSKTISYGGKPADLITMIDITDRKMAKEELEKNEEMHRTLLRTSPDAIIMSDIEGRITYASPQAARLNSIDNPEDLIGIFLLDLLAPKQRTRGAAFFKKILDQGLANNVILKHQRMDGSTFYGETNASVLNDPEGNPYGIIATTRDITKRINDEKELLMAKEKAVETDRLKSAFLANMSHEIRTPMNGIVGFADLVKNRNISTEKRNKYLDIIIDRSKHLLNIINDIIDISKIEAGEINIIDKEFNLNKMLNKLYSFFESQIQIKNFGNVELHLNSGLEDNDSQIYTDPVRLQQVLMNLISNAFKFTKKGFVEYGYTITDKKIINFYVKDTGIGLSNAEQKIIFGRFRQGENSDDELTQGTGLGLSISKGLIELMGGNIWVKSKKGTGSTFYFTIPFRRAIKTKLQSSAKKDGLNNKRVLENKTILVVEDDDTSYYYFKEILDQTNVNLLWVKDGSEAINLCRKNPDIDLVLMDIQLPQMNGYEAARKIKKFRQNLPVIAETAYALAGEKEKAVNAGCDDYLSKPIDKEVLLKKIKRILKRQNIL